MFQAQYSVMTAAIAGPQLRLAVRLHFDKETKAEEGEQSVRAALNMARLALNDPMAKVKQELDKDETPFSDAVGQLFALGMLRYAEAVLQTVTVERRGTAVTASLNQDVSTAMSLNVTTALAAISFLGRSAQTTFREVGAVLPTGPDNVGKPVEHARLKKIAMALNAYHDDRGHYPPAALAGKDGQPLLSWRVALLPYLGEERLYKEFKLDEPWDGPHNKKLLERMPQAYAASYPYGPGAPWRTPLQVFIGTGSVFEPGKTVRKADLRDGPGRTILVAEAEGEQMVPWTKPAELTFAAGQSLAPLYGRFDSGFHALFADGTVRKLTKTRVSEQNLRALITRAGGESVTLPD
jgi:hypothetical protein